MNFLKAFQEKKAHMSNISLILTGVFGDLMKMSNYANNHAAGAAPF